MLQHITDPNCMDHSPLEACCTLKENTTMGFKLTFLTRPFKQRASLLLSLSVVEITVTVIQLREQ